MRNTVKLNREFRYAYRKGEKLVTEHIVFYWYNNRQSLSKLGITVSAKIAGAVGRNRIKRLIRAAYSARMGEITRGCNIIVVARTRAHGASYADIKKSFDYCLKKAGLI